jgi:hypothetical protein
VLDLNGRMELVLSGLSASSALMGPTGHSNPAGVGAGGLAYGGLRNAGPGDRPRRKSGDLLTSISSGPSSSSIIGIPSMFLS